MTLVGMFLMAILLLLLALLALENLHYSQVMLIRIWSFLLFLPNLPKNVKLSPQNANFHNFSWWYLQLIFKLTSAEGTTKLCKLKIVQNATLKIKYTF